LVEEQTVNPVFGRRQVALQRPLPLYPPDGADQVSSWWGAMMGDLLGIEAQLLLCFEQCCVFDWPFRYWRLYDVFPWMICAALAALPLAPPRIDDTRGKRETHNSTRLFFSPEVCGRFRVCREIVDGFCDPAVRRRLEATCGVGLEGSFLRIEYCRDGEGFWLEPHTDIGAKLFTMQVYLSRGPGTEAWGTDLLDRAMNIVTTVPAVFNSALVFVPGDDTWHGFHKRPIAGVRRSIIVNYVKDEWRSRHELADPVRPVR
jgi:hypothetical protein